VVGPALRVVVCDDHPLVREGLRRILTEDPDVTVVQAVGTAGDAVEACRRHQPHGVLLDVSLPDASGLAAIARISDVSPSSRIIMLTMHEDVAYLREAFSQGAAGYLIKAAADVDLLTAVHHVARGGRYVHPSLGAAPAEPKASAAPSVISMLSKREKDVLRHLALGYTNRETAEILTISKRTVEAHRLRLQQKAGLRTRAELVRLADGAGLAR
jgi:DNA-binding NarL/FixJ family response regulator